MKKNILLSIIFFGLISFLNLKPAHTDQKTETKQLNNFLIHYAKRLDLPIHPLFLKYLEAWTEIYLKDHPDEDINNIALQDFDITKTRTESELLKFFNESKDVLKETIYQDPYKIQHDLVLNEKSFFADWEKDLRINIYHGFIKTEFIPELAKITWNLVYNKPIIVKSLDVAKIEKLLFNIYIRLYEFLNCINSIDLSYQNNLLSKSNMLFLLQTAIKEKAITVADILGLKDLNDTKALFESFIHKEWVNIAMTITINIEKTKEIWNAFNLAKEITLKKGQEKKATLLLESLLKEERSLKETKTPKTVKVSTIKTKITTPRTPSCQAHLTPTQAAPIRSEKEISKKQKIKEFKQALKELYEYEKSQEELQTDTLKTEALSRRKQICELKKAQEELTEALKAALPETADTNTNQLSKKALKRIAKEQAREALTTLIKQKAIEKKASIEIVQPAQTITTQDTPTATVKLEATCTLELQADETRKPAETFTTHRTKKHDPYAKNLFLKKDLTLVVTDEEKSLASQYLAILKVIAQESQQFLEDANTYRIINPLYSQQLLNQSIEKRAQVISLYNSIFRILNPDIVNRIEA